MDKRDALKRVLRKLHLPGPSAGFTAATMREVTATKEVANRLPALLKSHPLHAPASNFTFKTMSELKHRSQPAPPIIPRKTWYMATAILTFFVIILSVSGEAPATPPGPLTSVVLSSGRYLAGILGANHSFGRVVLMILVSIAALLLMERWLKTRSQQ